MMVVRNIFIPTLIFRFPLLFIIVRQITKIKQKFILRFRFILFDTAQSRVKNILKWHITT